MNIAKEIMFFCEIYFIKHDCFHYITVTIIKQIYSYSLYIAQPLAGERENDISVLENLRMLDCVICKSDRVVANLTLGPSSDLLTCSDMQSID